MDKGQIESSFRGTSDSERIRNLGRATDIEVPGLRLTAHPGMTILKLER